MAGLERDERAWIRRAQSGSVSDLEALFRAHWPRSYRASYLIVLDHIRAEDTVQEGFLGAVRTLHGFNADRPFAPWLHRVVGTRSLDDAQAELARTRVSGESLAGEAVISSWRPPHLDVAARELLAGLHSLPPEQRAVIVLRHLLEYSPSEVAGLLDVPRAAVDSWLRRGLDSLREGLQAGQLHERDLLNLLLQQPLPDEHVAEERTWDVVRAAFVARDPVPGRRRRPPWKTLAVLAVIGGIVAVVVTPAWDRVTEQLRDWLDEEPATAQAAPDPAPALGPVPGGGRLLATASGRVSIVDPDGSLRDVGAYDGAAWAPDGAVIAVWRDDRIDGLDAALLGDVRWSIPSDGTTGVSWSADGEALAFVQDGSLHTVAADGTGDRELVPDVAAAVPAWHPDDPEVIAYADSDGRVVVADAGTAKRLWRTSRAPVPSFLEWATDGLHVLAAAPQRLALFRVRQGPVAVLAIPRETGSVTSATIRPGGLAVAFAVRAKGAAQTTISLLERGSPRVLLSVPGRVGKLVWSPDGRWLAVSWPRGNQWLYVPGEGRGPVRVEGQVAGTFPGDDSAGASPAVVEWCCRGGAAVESPE